MLCDSDNRQHKECAALYDVHDFSGHQLPHHWDILELVDGSATVNAKNGCLSTATSLTRVSMWAEPAALPGGRACGATCAKVWNVVR